MHATPSLPDHLLVATAVLLGIAHARWTYPRAVRRMKDGDAGARLRLYRYILAITWALTIAVACIWVAHGRPWSTLGVTPGAWYRTAAGAALAAVYVGLAVKQRRQLLARPDRLARLAKVFAPLRPMIPTDAAERRTFRAVSVTAGICEEFFFRGFVTWYASALAGPVAGVLVAAALFGLDHVYLGGRYAVKTGIGALAFAAVVLISGSLWPAMIIHAAADLVSGDLGERALRSPRDAAAPSSDPAVEPALTAAST